MIDVEVLAEAHTKYIVKLMEAHGEDSITIKKVQFHYKSAFLHGWKHAIEDKEEATTIRECD